MTSSHPSKKGKASAYRYLPLGYQPGHFDVLCGRGRRCYYHSGNEHFRSVVHRMIPNYNSATSKVEKGYILSVIVEEIRVRAGIGGFIKQDKQGQWYEVGDFLAREKVSQAFRDALSDKYKSSNAYKKMRREVEQTGQLFETYLQKTGRVSPDSSLCRPNVADSSAAMKAQRIENSVSYNTSNTKSRTTSTDSLSTASLFDLLDGDLRRQFQGQPNESGNFNKDPFEPSPIPAYNRYPQNVVCPPSAPLKHTFNGPPDSLESMIQVNNMFFPREQRGVELNDPLQTRGFEFTHLRNLSSHQNSFYL